MHREDGGDRRETRLLRLPRDYEARVVVGRSVDKEEASDHRKEHHAERPHVRQEHVVLDALVRASDNLGCSIRA